MGTGVVVERVAHDAAWAFAVAAVVYLAIRLACESHSIGVVERRVPSEKLAGVGTFARAG